MVSSTLFTTITSLALLSLAHAEGDIVPNIVVSKCPIDIACAQPVIPDITTIYENPPVIVWNNITSTSTKIIPVTKWNYTVVVEPVNVGQEGFCKKPVKHIVKDATTITLTGTEVVYTDVLSATTLPKTLTHKETMTQTLDCIKEVFESPPPTAAPVPPRENPVPKPPSGSPLPKADPPKEEEPVFRIQDEDRKDGDYDPFSDSMF